MNQDKKAAHPSDRRQFSRVHFRHELILRGDDGVIYRGAFNDISLKGMLFWSEPPPPEGTLLSGEMPLGEDVLRLQGEVLRVIPGVGTAIRFVEMDVESFSHLRRMVSLNMGDSERIDEEFFSSL